MMDPYRIAHPTDCKCVSCLFQKTKRPDAAPPTCDHRWHYHDGAKHCFKCRKTVEGADPPPGGAENEGGFTPYPDAPKDEPQPVVEVRSVYVASSWRNLRQPGTVAALRDAGFDVYDFRNPSDGDHGFHWSEIDPAWQEWTPETYRAHLTHPLAEVGFAKDMDALRAADAVVLVNPCGRSAHLEFAWALGAGKPGIILLSDGEPELMYKMATKICVSLDEVRAALQKGDE